MGDDAQHPRSNEGWLEVEGEPGPSHTVHCPRTEKDMPLRHCLGCGRYHSLAIDPTGKHIYLDCDYCADEARPTAR